LGLESAGSVPVSAGWSGVLQRPEEWARCAPHSMAGRRVHRHAARAAWVECARSAQNARFQATPRPVPASAARPRACGPT